MAATKKAPTRTSRAVSKKKTVPRRTVTKKPSKKVASKSIPLKKPKKKIRAKKKDTFVTGEPVTLPRSVSLALLNPFRYPINPDQIAVNTARIAGMAFVVLGAIFTIVNLQYFGSPFSIANSASSVNQMASPHSNYFPHNSDICYDSSHQDFDSYCNPDGTPLDECAPNYVLRNDLACDGGGTVPPPGPEIDPDSGCYIDDTACLDAFYAGGGGGTEPAQDPTPPVIFTVNAPTNVPLSGSVEVYFQVPYASGVTAYVFYNGTIQKYLPLGPATLEGGSNDVWKFLWDTTTHDDGDYRLKAVVTNPHGTYDDSDTGYYEVQNNFDTTTTDTTTTDTTTTDTTTTDTTTTDTTTTDTTTTDTTTTDTTTTDTSVVDGTIAEPNILINIVTPEPLSDSVQIDILTTNVNHLNSQVKIFAFKDTVPTNYTSNSALGYATHTSGDEWTFTWDTLDSENGEYRVIAVVVDQYGVLHDSDPFYVEVQNLTSDEEIDDTTLIDSEVDGSYYDQLIAPIIDLLIQEDSPVSGGVVLHIGVNNNAEFIEVYGRKRFESINHFIGLASKKDTERWRFEWDSRDMSNGEYILYVRVKDQYGLHVSPEVNFSVFNEIDLQYTDEEINYVQQIEDTADQYDTAPTEYFADEEPIIYLDETLEIEDEVSTDDTNPDGTTEERDLTVNDYADEILQEFGAELDEELDRLAAAIRSGDISKVEQVKQRIQDLRSRILDSILEIDESAELVQQIDERIRSVVLRLESDTQQTEEIIRDRVGDEVFKDSDDDGITDYDEVHLFNTNPFVADTDGDGFVDGAEILSGFDPNDDSAEAIVIYESPQEVGLVREDILVVESITTITRDPDDKVLDGVEAQAVITGRALANSFVTLYIFSTPVVITVKTDNDGGWSYRFDKELEDGEHEVYIGITDNTGKIVAKSEPLRFIKEAEAFTPIDAAAAGVVTQISEDTAFATQNIILIVLSISVVCIGLVLILLGFHLAKRRDEEMLAPPTEPIV